MSNRVAIWVKEGIAQFEVVEGNVEVVVIDFDLCANAWADEIVEILPSVIEATPDWHPRKSQLVDVYARALAEVSTNDRLFGS